MGGAPAWRSEVEERSYHGGGFAVPEDGCTTYRALYEGLARFERELYEHVYLENNLLFPRVVSLQARTEGGGGPTGGAR